jgi:hypothetical protein
VIPTGQWLLQKIIDSIIPIILSTGISLFANKRFIQRSQKKRLHSKTLSDESFKPWNNRINELCLIGGHLPLIEYSPKENRIIPVKLKSLDLIPHHSFLESHMITGYPSIWESWEKLYNRSQDYLLSMSNIHEAIRSQISAERKHFGLVEYYHRLGTKSPQEYIRPDLFASQIYSEIDQRLSGMDDWIGGQPTKSFSNYPGGVRIHHLDWNNQTNLVHNRDENIIDWIIEIILRYVENDDYIKDIAKIRNVFDEIIDMRDNLQESLEEMTSKIDLVNDVKGRCDAC